MTSHMYWIDALLFACMLSFILLHDIKRKHQNGDAAKNFRTVLIWVIVFCLQDCVWGLCAAGVIKGNRAFFIESSVFHMSTVLTTFFWLNYVLTILDSKVKNKRFFLIIDGLFVLFQTSLVISNFFTPVIFSIRDGVYVTERLRPLCFLNQYAVYLIIGVVTAVLWLREKRKEREKFLTVFFYALAPILMGIFQLLYPDGPFYSMGYFLGCFVIHLFLVTKEMEEAANRELWVSTYEDSLTGVANRRAFEKDYSEYSNKKIESDLVFGSLDVNGLKNVNDALGHEAGDEMLAGAAECMQRCMGSYGHVYRTGGDEFNVILFASLAQLENIKEELSHSFDCWRGELSDHLSVSCGFVHVSEVERPTIKELSQFADRKMYAEKRRYYTSNGIDRRSLRDAHVALCRLYTKILRINLTEDTYIVVDVDDAETAWENGINESISGWLSTFGHSDMVHPDDSEEYAQKTDLEYMRKYFKAGNNLLRIAYRRKIDNSYKAVIMEIIRANDYSDDNQNLYLYVKNIED